MGFDVWQKVLMLNVVASATPWGIPAARVTAMSALQTTWNAAYLDYITHGTGVVAKDAARDTYEVNLRKLVMEWLAFNSNVTDDDRAKMGLTVESDTHTPVPVPTSFPELHIDISVPMQHSLRYTDSETLGKAKPKGVHGCEIWMKLEDPASTEVARLEFLETCTKAPFVNKFAKVDANKKVTYQGRWVNPRGKSGAFGPEVHSVVVP